MCVGFDGYTAWYAWLLWPTTANSLVRDSSSTKRRLLGFYPPTLWDYIRWLLVYMVDGYLWIVSSFPICYWLLQQQYYSSSTTAAGVIVPRVIAVGQHYCSAPRNPFLSQRLKCETTGRSATAPDLDDKGSPRGAALFSEITAAYFWEVSGISNLTFYLQINQFWLNQTTWQIIKLICTRILKICPYSVTFSAGLSVFSGICSRLEIVFQNHIF